MTTADQPACYVHDISTAVPEQYFDQQQTLEKLEQMCINRRSRRLLQRLVRLTGIEKRHLAALDHQEEDNRGDSLFRPAEDQPHGPGMAARTAMFDESVAPLIKRLLADLGADDLSEVRSLITASCTHASSPGLEQPIFAYSNVPPSVDRWNLGFMGCSAGLAAMRLAHQTAALKKEALIVACELSSLHFQYTDQLDQMTANLIFADGAAAMRLSPRRSPVRIVGCRCASFPAQASQMVWFATEQGLQLRLSQKLPHTLAATLPGEISKFLRAQCTSVDRIHHWLVHPGGPQILDSVQQCLHLGPDALAISRKVLRTYGNMSSPTIFFILKELLSAAESGPVVAIAFGPGLTIEIVLLQVDPR